MQKNIIFAGGAINSENISTKIIQQNPIYSGKSPDSGGDVPPPAVITSKFLASENHVAFLKDNSFYHCGIKELQGNNNAENVSEVMVNFVVTDSEPSSDNIGGILLPYQQMQFKKVGGDLYMKSASANGEINIEQSE